MRSVGRAVRGMFLNLLSQNGRDRDRVETWVRRELRVSARTMMVGDSRSLRSMEVRRGEG